MNVLFDLDGTLIDPKEGITKSIQYALEKMGLEIPPADSLEWCIGPPLQDLFGQIIGEEGAAVDRGMELYRERFSEKGLYENQLYAGVKEMLGSLRSGGYRTFIATSKPIVYTEKIADHLALSALFDGIYGSELDGTRRKKADLLSHLLAQESIDPSDALMVGDREHDLIGAAANGIKSIGVSYGYGSVEELECHKPVTICASPEELGAYIAGNYR